MKTINLLAKPIWSVKEIMQYTDFGKTKCYELMKVAKTKYQGCVGLSSSVVKRDSVLLALNTSIERETYVIKVLKKGGKDEETLQNWKLWK